MQGRNGSCAPMCDTDSRKLVPTRHSQCTQVSDDAPTGFAGSAEELICAPPMSSKDLEELLKEVLPDNEVQWFIATKVQALRATATCCTYACVSLMGVFCVDAVGEEG